MKKNQKILALGILAIIVIVALCAAFLVSRPGNNPGDACTSKDREQNNCVPAGRCTPLGDPREATTDCVIKNYDHKFNLGK